MSLISERQLGLRNIKGKPCDNAAPKAWNGFGRRIALDREYKPDTLWEISARLWQLDEFVSAIAIVIPEEHVIPWLKDVERIKFSVGARKPFELIPVEGIPRGGRDNLIFAANHCDFGQGD